MSIFFRISFLVFCGILLFHFLWENFPKIFWGILSAELNPIVSSEPLVIIPQDKLCIKDPNIEFFMYHYIRDHDPHDNFYTKDLSVAPVLFEAHMLEIESLAKEKKIYLMQWNDFIYALDSWCFPGKNIWIFTADDGWIDMKDSLVPIVSRHGIPFFLWIITNRLDTSWFLSKNDVENISKNPLITISSHSISHSDNSKLSVNEETHEMCDSREILKNLSGQKVETYTYPSGRINPTIDESIAKKCGYKLAWSTSFGNSYDSHTGSIFDINRIRINSETDPHFFDVFLNEIEKRNPSKK